MATDKTEAYELKRIGAVPQKNSGRGKHDKGDGILDDYWLVDVKEYAVGFMVSLVAWAKICTDAFRAGQKEPMLLLVLGSKDKTVRLVVHSYDDFQRMKDRIRELESMVQ